MAIEVGKPAPAFTLLNKGRERITQESFPGKHIVLAFYPLAFTGGCTSEMQAFRDTSYRFEKANAQVLGVSVDSWAAAGEFQEKLGAEFPLLSDFPKNETGKAFEVHNEAAGIHGRTTVVIDKDGIVRSVFSEARDFAAHPVAALEALKEIGEDTSE